MSEQTSLLGDRVLTVKDDGHKRQWGVGRLFLQWEGAKKRINTKTTFATVAICFLFTAVLGIFRKHKEVITGKSAVNMNVSVVQENHIPNYDPSYSTAPVQGVSSGTKKTTRNGGTEGLLVTRRNAAGKVPPGTMVRAKLLSGASNGFVKATLLESVSPFGNSYFASGTTIVGVAASNKERLSIQFKKVVMNDGSVMDIHAQACDGVDKMPGIAGVNVRSQALSLAGAVGLNFAGGVAMGLQGQGSQDPERKPTMKDSLLNGAAVAALERGRDISQDLKSEEPLIEIDEGTEFFLLFLGEG